MIAALIVLAYLTTNLYAARAIYGWRRARAIDNRAAKYAKYTYTGHLYDPVEEFNEYDRWIVLVESVVAAVFWPITLAGICLHRFVTSNPALSRTELAAERAAMADRIRELETELDIKEQP